jgi:ParB family chromosome partitioning protein
MARRGLGRGLNALIPTIEEPSESELNAVIELPLDKITPNKNQPRNKFSEDSLAELAESIKEFGVIQPIVVRKLDGMEKYEIITGERRYRATKSTGISTIPSIVINDVDDTSSLEMALIENIQREDLNAMERAHTYKQLIEEFKITHEKLSKKIGKSRTSITNTLRLLTLPEEIQKLINEGKISEGHARAILILDNNREKINLANHIIKNDLSVREAERIAERKVKQDTGEKAEKILQFSKAPEISRELSDFLNAPVKVTMSKKKGKIVIEFGTVKDLERIVEKIVR